jgi:hypothetical protein
MIQSKCPRHVVLKNRCHCNLPPRARLTPTLPKSACLQFSRVVNFHDIQPFPHISSCPRRSADSFGFNPCTTMDIDLLVIGTGVAGCTAALQAADRGQRVTILTSADDPLASNSFWAQVRSKFALLPHRVVAKTNLQIRGTNRSIPIRPTCVGDPSAMPLELSYFSYFVFFINRFLCVALLCGASKRVLRAASSTRRPTKTNLRSSRPTSTPRARASVQTPLCSFSRPRCETGLSWLHASCPSFCITPRPRLPSPALRISR